MALTVLVGNTVYIALLIQKSMQLACIHLLICNPFGGLFVLLRKSTVGLVVFELCMHQKKKKKKRRRKHPHLSSNMKNNK